MEDMIEEFSSDRFTELYKKIAEVVDEHEPAEVVAVCCIILAHAIETSEDPKAAMNLIKEYLHPGSAKKEEEVKTKRKKS